MLPDGAASSSVIQATLAEVGGAHSRRILDLLRVRME